MEEAKARDNIVDGRVKLKRMKRQSAVMFSREEGLMEYSVFRGAFTNKVRAG